MKKCTYKKSPLNYTGGKHRLLPQILPLFPDDIRNFVDLFCGGCNVAINVNAEMVIANDIVPQVIGMYKRFMDFTPDELTAEIERRIAAAGLNMTDHDPFNTFREVYNKSEEKDPLDLYILICYAFNHQIRFNGKGEYNMPFGKNRSQYNPTIKKNLIAFREAIENIRFVCKDFRELKLDKLHDRDFVYCDPPYLITCATYNERDGWNDRKERDLLNLLDGLNERGIRFALSNVIESGGETNEILNSWSGKYKTYHLSNTYSNSSYHKKERGGITDEVLITNY